MNKPNIVLIIVGRLKPDVVFIQFLSCEKNVLNNFYLIIGRMVPFLLN